MSGIYCIKNKITKRVYIGKSVCIEERWEIHKKKLENKSHENYLMQQDYNNYGIDSFEFRVLEETETDDNILFIRERIWGQKLNSKDPVFGYNIGEFYTGDLLEEDRNKYKVGWKLILKNNLTGMKRLYRNFLKTLNKSKDCVKR